MPTPLIFAAIRLALQKPSAIELRRTIDLVQRGDHLDSPRILSALAREAFAYTRCWSLARLLAIQYIDSRLGNLTSMIRAQVPVRTGAARRSVQSIKGHSTQTYPISVNFEFDVGTTEQYSCAITVSYAQYLRNVRDWFFPICTNWYQDTQGEALIRFVSTYTTCATSA